MKRCPYCDENVRDKAVKCKHCGSKLNGAVLTQDMAENHRHPILKLLSFVFSFFKVFLKILIWVIKKPSYRLFILISFCFVSILPILGEACGGLIADSEIIPLLLGGVIAAVISTPLLVYLKCRIEKKSINSKTFFIAYSSLLLLLLCIYSGRIIHSKYKMKKFATSQIELARSLASTGQYKKALEVTIPPYMRGILGDTVADKFCGEWESWKGQISRSLVPQTPQDEVSVQP